MSSNISSDHVRIPIISIAMIHFYILSTSHFLTWLLPLSSLLSRSPPEQLPDGSLALASCYTSGLPCLDRCTRTTRIQRDSTRWGCNSRKLMVERWFVWNLPSNLGKTVESEGIIKKGGFFATQICHVFLLVIPDAAFFTQVLGPFESMIFRHPFKVGYVTCIRFRENIQSWGLKAGHFLWLFSPKIIEKRRFWPKIISERAAKLMTLPKRISQKIKEWYDL